MSAKVSVIMGIYQCAGTLPEALDSLMRQTFTDWRLIMCDDGSTDLTYSVAEKYCRQYPDKMMVIRNEKNLGLNQTLNRCLEFADGLYVARMDGDDVSLPDRFEKEVRFLDEHPAYAIVSCPMIYFDENGEFKRGKGNGEPSVSSLCKGTPFCHAPCMVRREAFAAVDGYAVSPKRLRVEDWDLWIRMYEKGYRGFNLEEPLYMMRDDRNACKRRKYRYRFNEASVSASAVKKLKLKKSSYIYVFRPLLVGLLPRPVYQWLHRIKAR